MNYQRFEELTSLVTVVGDEADRKRAFKAPLTACDMLSSDLSLLDNFFLPPEGVVKVEEKITKSVEKEVDEWIEDDSEEEEKPKEEG